MATNSSNTVTTSPAGDAATPRFVGERFAMGACVDSRQGASYHLATDSQTGGRVLVKLLPQKLLSTSIEMRLEYETGAAAKITRLLCARANPGAIDKASASPRQFRLFNTPASDQGVGIVDWI